MMKPRLRSRGLYLQVRRRTENVEKGPHGWVEYPSEHPLGQSPLGLRASPRMPMATEGRVIDIYDRKTLKQLPVSQEYPDMIKTRIDLDQQYYFGDNSDVVTLPEVPGEIIENSAEDSDLRRVAEGEYLVPQTWDELGMNGDIQQIATQWVGERPSTIQKDIIPAMLKLKDRDIVYSSVTGTGKTMAYILALLHLVSEEERGISLVLVPSKQLALQVYSHILKWSEKGARFNRVDKEWLQIHLNDPNEDRQRLHDDYKRLKSTWYGGPRIVIAQPERWSEYLLNWKLSIPIRRIVIDEAFTCFQPIDPIKADRYARAERDQNPNPTDIVMSFYLAFPAFKSLMRAQVILLTATFTELLQNHVVRYLKPDKWTHLTTRRLTPRHISYDFLPVPEGRLTSTFISTAIEQNPHRAVVFVDNNESIERVYEDMVESGMNVRLFDLGDGKLPPFQDYSWQYLLLKEQVGYGLDLKGVTHVYVLHCPTSTEAFCHMAGRTGRFGNGGKVVSFIDAKDKVQWHAYMHLLDLSISPGGVDLKELEEDVRNELAVLAEKGQQDALQRVERGVMTRYNKKKKLLFSLARQKGEAWAKEAPVGSITQVMEENVKNAIMGPMEPDELEEYREKKRDEFIKAVRSFDPSLDTAKLVALKEHNNDIIEREMLTKAWGYTHKFTGRKKKYMRAVAISRSKFHHVLQWKWERLLRNFQTTSLLPDEADPNPTMPPVSRRIVQGTTKKWANFKDLPPYPGYKIHIAQGTFDHDKHEEDTRQQDARPMMNEQIMQAISESAQHA